MRSRRRRIPHIGVSLQANWGRLGRRSPEQDGANQTDPLAALGAQARVTMFSARIMRRSDVEHSGHRTNTQNWSLLTRLRHRLCAAAMVPVSAPIGMLRLSR